jgi:hypothetical protein
LGFVIARSPLELRWITAEAREQPNLRVGVSGHLDGWTEHAGGDQRLGVIW